MRIIITFVAFLFVMQCAFSQSYMGVLENMHKAIKGREVLTARLSFLEENEDRETRLTKFLYADNRSASWRAIYIPELQKTIYFDGTSKTYSFYHRINKLEIHEGMLAIEAMKEYLDVVSSDLLARRESKINKPDSKNVNYVDARGEGKVELVTIIQGDIGLGLKDKTIRYLIDTIRQLPVQLVDSTYFLERLIKRQEIVDKVYSDIQAVDSFYTLINEWMKSYSLFDDSTKSYDDFAQFSYDTIYRALTFINHPPDSARYILLDFYYVGCVACLECLPNIKKLIGSDDRERVSVLAISGYDRKDKIERFNRVYGVEYSSASIPLSDLNSIVGHIVYPTFVLFDSSGVEIARASGCDQDFFEHVAQIISKP